GLLDEQRSELLISAGQPKQVRMLAYSTISLFGNDVLEGDGERFEARADHRECNLTHFLVAADVGHGLKDALEQLPRERRVLGQLTVSSAARSSVPTRSSTWSSNVRTRDRGRGMVMTTL